MDVLILSDFQIQEKNYMDNFDYEKYYHTVLADYCEVLEQEFADILKEKEHLLEAVVLRDHMSEIGYRQNWGLITTREPNERNTTAYNEQRNSFKKDLVQKFNNIESRFKENHINNFVKYDLPNLRKTHIEWYEKNKSSKEYEWDSQYMYTATDKEILELIAKYNSYDLFRENHPRRSNHINKLTDSDEEKKTKGGSTAQTVLSIILLNEIYKIKKHQDQKPLAEYIVFLTGRNKRNVTDFVSKYINGNGFMHSSTKQNIKDYEAVKTHFQRLDNQKVIELIDQRIKKLETMNDK